MAVLDLDGLTAAVDNVCDADPSALADGDALVAISAQLERMTAAVTRAAGRFDAGGEWAADGARSAAAWMSTRCRIPRRTAQRRVGVARSLRRMPLTEAAWLSGSIGEEQVVLLRRARETAPSVFARDESLLVGEAAELQHRHLVRVVALWRQLAAPEETEKEADDDYQARRAHLSPGLRGTAFLDVLFDQFGYAIFEETLRLIEQELFLQDWAEARARLGDTFTVADLRRTPAQRRHDALVEMARRARALPQGARLPEPLFTLHIGDETARRLCQLANGTVVTPGSAVRWLDEAWIERFAAALPDRPVNVSVRRRLFTGGTRRAVEVQHTECFHEVCDVPVARCEIDHNEPYAAGGLTVSSNGRPACAFHNRLRLQQQRPNPEPDPPPPPGDLDDRPP